MSPTTEKQTLPSRRVKKGRRVILPERQFLKDQRLAGIHIKRYLSRAIRNAQKFILESAKNYDRLVEQAYIDFPSHEEVLKRWEKVKNKINVKNPHAWDPNRFPMSFLDYKDKIVNAQSERELVNSLTGINASAYLKTVTLTAKQLGIAPLYNPEALAALQEHTFKIVTTDINETLANYIRDRINTSIQKGMTIEETAHSLGQLNTNWRTIAKTEVMNAVNKGAFDQVSQETKDTGLVTLKGWLHSGNSNGRQSHVQAGVQYGPGNEIPLDEPFIVGGEQMMHPHDQSASAENVINCGCTVFYTVPEGAI